MPRGSDFSKTPILHDDEDDAEIKLMRSRESSQRDGSNDSRHFRHRHWYLPSNRALKIGPGGVISNATNGICRDFFNPIGGEAFELRRSAYGGGEISRRTAIYH